MSVIDLFAGAGGFSLAAHQAGLDVVAAIELDAQAAATYKNNIVDRLGQKTEVVVGDILKIEPSDLRKKLSLEIGELELMLGGPPCQGFSTHRINNAGVDDPRNKLLLRYYDFVQAFQPKAFLVENVSGLFWKKHESYLKKFRRLASKNGYKILFCDTLNAKDYGVPQHRKRAFILGIRKDLNIRDFDFPPSQDFFSSTSKEVMVEGKPAWRSASCVFEPLTQKLVNRYIKEYFIPKTKLSRKEAQELLNSLEFGKPVHKNDPNNIHMQPSEKMVRRFISTPLNGSRMDAAPEFELRCHSNGYVGHKDVYGRVFIHTPSNTITTGCNNPSKGRFVHPWLHHGFTLRHAARLQTFPDDFIFTGSTTDQAKQIGNAVPPLFVQKLIENICASFT